MTVNDICLSPLNETTYFDETAISLLVLFQERRTAICRKRLAFLFCTGRTQKHPEGMSFPSPGRLT